MTKEQIMYSSVSVLKGWQTMHNSSGTIFGPAFNKVTDLWEWQHNNLTGENYGRYDIK
jgi:hypothetical protein